MTLLLVGDQVHTKRAKGKEDSNNTREIKLLEKQNMLSGRVFEPEAKEYPPMRELVDAVDLQAWTHLFE